MSASCRTSVDSLTACFPRSRSHRSPIRRLLPVRGCCWGSRYWIARVVNVVLIAIAAGFDIGRIGNRGRRSWVLLIAAPVREINGVAAQVIGTRAAGAKRSREPLRKVGAVQLDVIHCTAECGWIRYATSRRCLTVAQ